MNELSSVSVGCDGVCDCMEGPQPQIVGGKQAFEGRSGGNFSSLNLDGFISSLTHARQGFRPPAPPELPTAGKIVSIVLIGAMGTEERENVHTGGLALWGLVRLDRSIKCELTGRSDLSLEKCFYGWCRLEMA